MSPCVFVVGPRLALFRAEGGALLPVPGNKEHLMYSVCNGHHFGGNVDRLITPAATEQDSRKLGVC